MRGASEARPAYGISTSASRKVINETPRGRAESRMTFGTPTRHFIGVRSSWAGALRRGISSVRLLHSSQ